MGGGGRPGAAVGDDVDAAWGWACGWGRLACAWCCAWLAGCCGLACTALGRFSGSGDPLAVSARRLRELVDVDVVVLSESDADSSDVRACLMASKRESSSAVVDACVVIRC